uniref:Uncharacterized protein n=1 Tax=Tanacetum cinerariifolium TaxID=118510 RepID=A0A6L2KU97_TANCI|nr:hypothetical protein [Tanacetum cinerariifolium]
MSFKTYSNPLFDLDEEIISSEFNPIHNKDLESTLKNDRFDTEPYLLESLPNRDTLMSSPLKIDSLLAEFSHAFIFLKSIPSGIDEADCDPEEDIHLVKRLLYDNSSPHPPKEFVSKNSNANTESFFPSPIPNEDSDSFMEEIDLFLTPDDSMPPALRMMTMTLKGMFQSLKNFLTIIPFHSMKISHTILIFLHPIVLMQNHQMVKENKEKDKIGTKPDQIKKKKEAWKSPAVSKASHSQESRKEKKIQNQGTKTGKS